MKIKIRKIAGRKIALLEGVRYRASRPFATRFREVFPVTISPMIGAPTEAGEKVIDGMSYDEANRFLSAFNNGATSFDGREW